MANRSLVCPPHEPTFVETYLPLDLESMPGGTAQRDGRLPMRRGWSVTFHALNVCQSGALAGEVRLLTCAVCLVTQSFDSDRSIRWKDVCSVQTPISSTGTDRQNGCQRLEAFAWFCPTGELYPFPTLDQPRLLRVPASFLFPRPARYS